MAIIDKPTDYFNSILWTGNDTDNRTISGVGFSLNWAWIKARNNADQHYLVDSVRGSTKVLHSDSTEAEATRVSAVKSFTSDGYVLGQEAQVNRNGGTFVGWNWKEETGVFDIVSYTGNGSNRTISHNLGTVPKMIIYKNLSVAKNWVIYHEFLGTAAYIYLDLTNASDTGGASSYFNGAAPTTSVFSAGTDADVNGNGNSYIAYLFGNSSMSKMGSYEGNGSADGTFVYLGFKPAFLMVKPVDAADNWVMFDNKRLGFNSSTSPFNFAGANNTNAETTDTGQLDLLSNGFKIRNSGGTVNKTSTYIYMAFAENPFVTSTSNGSIPATAR
jgi:hypothetical protein